MSWNGIRSTLQWLLLLSLLGVIGVGGAGLHFWFAKDGLLAAGVHKKLTEVLPDCLIEFEGMRFIDASHLELTRLGLRSRRTNAQLIHIPRIVIEYDAAMLRDHRRIVIREISAQAPEMLLARDHEGHWNWEGFSLRQPDDGSSPRWIIRNGAIRVGFQSTPRGPFQSIGCQGIDASFVPQAHRRYDIAARGVAETFGPMLLSGRINADSGEWQLAGSAGEVRLSDALLELAGCCAPGVAERLAEVRAVNQAIQERIDPSAPLRTASRGDAPLHVGAPEPAAADGPLLRADVALTFAARQSYPGAAIDYEVHGDIRGGHLSRELVPVPLYDLAGQFEVTPTRVQLTGLRAGNGPSMLYLDGHALWEPAGWDKQFSLRAAQFQLDERIRGILPADWIPKFDLVRPAGTFDIELDVVQPAGGEADYSLKKFAARGCRALCSYFQYPVENIRGEVTQEAAGFRVELEGDAAGRPVELSGMIGLPGPDQEVELRIHVRDLPIDDAFRNALRGPEQQEILETIEELRLRGRIPEGRVTIYKNDQTNDELEVALEGDVADATLSYEGFPYEITAGRCRFHYDPLTRDAWRFVDISARHEGATITGVADLDLSGERPRLELDLSLINVPVDYELEKAATRASPELGRIWRDFELGGTLDVERLRVEWTPEREPAVTLTGIQWRNGHLLATSALPYRWEDVAGTLHWDGSRLRIHTLSGWHGGNGVEGTYVEINGVAPATAFIEIPDDERVSWIVHIDDLQVRRLNPDDEFRRALPTTLREAITQIDLRGLLDLRIEVDMKGWKIRDDLVTARWKSEIQLRDNALQAGTSLSQLTGRAIVRDGVWDGENLRLEGDLDIATLRAFNLPFRHVRGPFSLTDQRLTLGTPQAARIAAEQQGLRRGPDVEAAIYGGAVGLDLEVELDERGIRPYVLELNVWDVELEQFAQDFNIHGTRLQGKVNAKLKAVGHGNQPESATGDGWVQIMPAALGELPVFVQLTSLPAFRQGRNTLFKYADGEFELKRGFVDFSKIVLKGDSLNLSGKGKIGYAGADAPSFDLQFLIQANNPIPFVNQLTRFVSDNWVQVKVTGVRGDVVAVAQPSGGPFETLRSLIQDLGPAPPRRDRERPRTR